MKTSELPIISKSSNFYSVWDSRRIEEDKMPVVIGKSIEIAIKKYKKYRNYSGNFLLRDFTIGETDMNEEEFRNKLASLRTKIAINDARVMSNPKKYIQENMKYCYELLKVLEDVEYALSPDYIFDVWNPEAAFTTPNDIQGEALIRCDAALDVIRSWKTGKK